MHSTQMVTREKRNSNKENGARRFRVIAKIRRKFSPAPKRYFLYRENEKRAMIFSGSRKTHGTTRPSCLVYLFYLLLTTHDQPDTARDLSDRIRSRTRPHQARTRRRRGDARSAGPL